VPTRVKCESCNGTGSEDKNRAAETCPTCQGAGKVRTQQGFFLVERTCPTCAGQGRVIRNPCRVCSGAGTVQRERSLQVAIPAGVEDGTRIRVTGEGEAGGAGAQNGDLYVHVAIKPHEFFQREQANILMRVPLRMTQAALGDEIEVPVVDGTRAKVKIPAGTQTGDQFRLRGKGFSVLRSAARGDMFIQVAVETPQNLSAKQRELLEAFETEAHSGGKGSPDHEGFFAKVAAFFEGGRS
jgi:molecular chaperone DnaJ